MKFAKSLLICLSFVCSSFAGSITSVTPDSAIPGERVTITLNCANTAFTSDTVLGVALIRESVIVMAESFTAINDTQMQAVLLLPDTMAKGDWKAAVNLQSGDLYLEKCFSVFNPDINGDGFIDMADFGYYAKDFRAPMPGYILVPDIQYLTRSQAEAAIIAAGLRIGYIRTVLSAVQYGFVAGQSPIAGKPVKASDNIAIDFDVSGVPLITFADIPELFMYGGGPITLVQAQAVFISEGFSIGQVTFEHSSTVPQGCVIRYDPPGLSSAAYIYDKSEIKIDIVVSSEPQWGVVPGLYGLPQAQAREMITGCGFKVGAVTTQYNPSVPVGCVVSQNPPAGQQHSQPQNVFVNFDISGVPLITFTVVPNLSGLTPAQANAAITAAGLLVGTAQDATTSLRVTDEIRDKVIAVCSGEYVCIQTPEAGTHITGDDSRYVNYIYARDCYLINK